MQNTNGNDTAPTDVSSVDDGSRSNNKGRGRGRDREKNERGGRKRLDMGRSEWKRSKLDKRKWEEDHQEGGKRQRSENEPSVPGAGVQFSKEEIAEEARKPKRKVAVLIGYAGSGYKGMQINNTEKTIEGDIFKAFVAAGAISKANADDPKKSSLVRCARTDKGVHAAGNVISLKLIVEDPNIVQAINEHLPPQIRVWGIERTNGSFSCYQSCDSRWYEYLIPTYSFLPPHPQSYLGKKLVEIAEREGLYESYMSRQEEVASFWEEAEAKYIQPILEKLEPALRDEVMAAIHSSEDEDEASKTLAEASKSEMKPHIERQKSAAETPIKDSGVGLHDPAGQPDSSMPIDADSTVIPAPEVSQDQAPEQSLLEKPVESDIVPNGGRPVKQLSPFDKAVKEVKAAYITARKAYRISEKRRERVQEALLAYIGTQNFHNYTIQKSFKDPSAKRVIRSFKVGPKLIIINDTEWLSLKVHGQSFMMHQIRKMVAMATLIVRCGASTQTIHDSYGSAKISIPKAPGLGLLLERPVFDSYNEKAVNDFGREKIDFDKYQNEMDEFKQREIYDRIFREEEKEHQFYGFFHHVDHYKSDYFLWVTAGGISAAKQGQLRRQDASDDEVDSNGEEG
ncbi:pseudouridine synthase [Xylogone sp. PMI_703]|nr:pseudouridine synthase [Xylogone sp. PMI_703]